MKYQVATRYGIEVGIFDTLEEAQAEADNIDGVVNEMEEMAIVKGPDEDNL